MLNWIKINNDFLPSNYKIFSLRFFDIMILHPSHPLFSTFAHRI